MGKLVNNPPFTQSDDSFNAPKKLKEEEVEEGDEEVKEPPAEEAVEESEPSTEEKDEGKERELAGLEKEDEKLAQELSELDKQIAVKKQAIVAKRRDRRLQKEALKEIPEPEEEIDLSEYDPEELKRFDTLLKAKGIVSKSEIQAELYKTRKREIETKFFEEHPEYLPENDPGDVLYKAFREEFGEFARPKTVAKIQKLLKKAHKEVKERYPDRFPKKEAPSADAAKRQKKALASAGAGVPGSTPSKRRTSLTPEQIATLKRGGFTDEDIEGM